MGFGSRGKSCRVAIGSRIFGWVGVEQSAEHSYEVVPVVRSVAVRRRTRFPLLVAPFPAAPILRATFLDFRVNFRIIGRKGFVPGNPGYPVRSNTAGEVPRF